MSWLAKLHETYEHGLTLDQSHLSIEERLLPMSHTLQNAHINIVIDGKGNFRRAEVLEKKQIVLPATEASAGRVGTKPPPHSLADKIQYVAKDYCDYGGRKTSFFDAYEKQLGQWCSSDFSHSKACAVHAYISKGHVVADLINEGVLHCDASGLLLTSWPLHDHRPHPVGEYRGLPHLSRRTHLSGEKNRRHRRRSDGLAYVEQFEYDCFTTHLLTVNPTIYT